METLAILLGGGALGAMATSVFKYLTNRREQTLTNEEKLREELQAQIDALKEEVKELRTEVGYWRERYFEIYQEHVILKAKLEDE